MKKIYSVVLILILLITLSACNTDKVEIPDLVGMDYGDVVKWAADVEINLIISSGYNDEVEPNSVYFQGTKAGIVVPIESELEIMYSRGYDPNGEIIVPDFTGMTENDIRSWLSHNDIAKYSFSESFDSSGVDSYIGYEVTKTEVRSTILRKDTFTFYFSKGELDIDEVVFDNRYAVRGVNLGGWFVLEGWMTPDLFQGVDGSDETAFMQQKPNAASVLETHWNTFITEDDFAWLSDHGINYVRIPIPWWYQGVENAYEGSELEVDYADSSFYIKRAMTWAETHNIKVLLDLHTAPGCQNGFDNGGIAGVQDWGHNEATTGYVATTLEVIDAIASDFTGYESLWGIEVLNEPTGWSIDRGVLTDYYKDSYDIIRGYDLNVWVGFHDAFTNWDTGAWTAFFTDNDFTNVFFDVHLYQVFGDGWGDFDIYDHVDFVYEDQADAVARYQGIVPQIIGEWSLGLQGNVFEGLNAQSVQDVRKAYASAQLNVFEDGLGWFFWNYKIDRSSHLEWDFRRLIEEGVVPSDFNPFD